MKKTGIRLFALFILFTTMGCTNHYEEGKKFYENKNYKKSITEFKQVSKNDKNYNNSHILLTKADSLIKIIKRNKFVKDSITFVKDSITNAKGQLKKDSIALVEKKLAIENEIKRLRKELNDIKTFNGKEYRDRIDLLVFEMDLFSIWGKLANDSKNNENLKIKKLGKSIEQNLKLLQLKEFPKIRANYAKILKNKLWEDDIKVQNFGYRKTTLQFTGGTFTLNKSIKDFQTTLSQTFKDFRFKRINYKWYKYDDEYTYYIIKSDKDSKIKIH